MFYCYTISNNSNDKHNNLELLILDITKKKAYHLSFNLYVGNNTQAILEIFETNVFGYHLYLHQSFINTYTKGVLFYSYIDLMYSIFDNCKSEYIFKDCKKFDLLLINLNIFNNIDTNIRRSMFHLLNNINNVYTFSEEEYEIIKTK